MNTPFVGYVKKHNGNIINLFPNRRQRRFVLQNPSSQKRMWRGKAINRTDISIHSGGLVND